MKNIFRVIGFGLAVFVVTASNAAMSYAQANPCDDSFEVKTAEYDKFKLNINKPNTVEKLKIALDVGNAYVTKYKDCDDTKEVVADINKKLPIVQKVYDRLDRNERFNKNVPAKNWAESFKAGKQIIAAESDAPVALDVALVLASIGFDEAAKKNDTFNNDALEMARLAIQKIEAGVTTDKFGAFGIYEYKTKDYPDGKANALGWMNYVIGYITYFRQDKKKEALPYLYTAVTKYNSATKNFPEIYEMIGAYYYAELVKIDEQRTKLITANANKDNDETLAMWAMELGYLDRTIDANARAYSIANKIASATTATQAQKDNKTRIYTKLQDFYKDRFKKTEGLDTYIATLTSKPMIDPMTPVEPVKEETPAATTTATTTTTTTTTTNPTTTTTKPTTTTTNPTTTTKPTTNTTTTTTTKPSTSTTKPKTPVKKKKSR